jgi:hypothetical protein
MSAAISKLPTPQQQQQGFIHHHLPNISPDDIFLQFDALFQQRMNAARSVGTKQLGLSEV